MHVAKALSPLTLFLGLFSTIGATCALGQIWTTDVGTVAFYSRVPLHSFTGTSEKLTGSINLTDSTIAFRLELATLKTGNKRRDHNMRSALETDAFPFAEFAGQLRGAFDENDDSAQDVLASGMFSIHGISRDVSVQGTLRPVDAGLELKASWTLSLKDFEIKPRRLLVVKVVDEQTIEISATLSKADP